MVVPLLSVGGTGAGLEVCSDRRPKAVSSRDEPQSMFVDQSHCLPQSGQAVAQLNRGSDKQGDLASWSSLIVPHEFRTPSHANAGHDSYGALSAMR